MALTIIDKCIEFFRHTTELDTKQRETLADTPTADLVPSASTNASRRYGERIPQRLPAKLVCSFGGMPEPAFIKDLSHSGLYLLAEHDVPYGSQIEVYATLPAEEPGQAPRFVRYIGVVRRVDTFPNENIFGIAASIRRCELADACAV